MIDFDLCLPDDKPMRASKLSSSNKSQNYEPVPIRRTSLPQYASCTDLDLTEDELDNGSGNDRSKKIPAPRQITFEPLQNKSVVIAWNPPEHKVANVASYQVVVDSNVHSSIKATEEPLKATITDLDLGLIHRVSVKSITKENRMSNEAACTIVIGKDAPLSPTSVKATRLTSTSATIAWIPSNTNFMHAITVNNVDVKTVKQGVFRHTLAGLSPNTTYKVAVRAKNLKAASYIGDSLTSTLTSPVIEIRTKPQGLPEPPLDIQVLKGPRDSAVSVTWLPVTINPSGTSNGAPVLGYEIYADGTKVKDVDSGTADNAIVDLKVPANAITMRTKSSNGTLSHESESCPIPLVLKMNHKPVTTASSGEQKPQQPLEEPREMIINYSSGYPELDSDIGPSELSDIAEEPEEGLTSEDNDSRGSTPKVMTRATNFLASSTPMNNNSNTASGLKKNTVSSVDTSESFNNALSRWSNLTYASSQFTAQPLIPQPKSLTKQESTKQPTQPPNTTTTTTKPQEPPQQQPVVVQQAKPHPVVQQPQPQQSQSVSTKVQISGSTAASNTSSSSTSSSTGNLNGSSGSNGPTTSSGLNHRIRIFVALFDYDPPTMSPNPDACDEELPFREGQLIKVYGEKDADGFYWGEANGLKGYVPCNMVSEVQVDDDRVAEELFKEQCSAGSSSGSIVGAGSNGNIAGTRIKVTSSSSSLIDDRWADIYEDMPAKRKLALYDYDPVELSPNVDAEVELSFQAGDIVLVCKFAIGLSCSKELL